VLTEITITTKALARVTAMPHKGVALVVVFCFIQLNSFTHGEADAHPLPRV